MPSDDVCDAVYWWEKSDLRLTLRAALAYRAAWWICTKDGPDPLTPESLPMTVRSVKDLLEHLGEAGKDVFMAPTLDGQHLEVRSVSVGNIHLLLTEDTETEDQRRPPRLCGHFSSRPDDGILELYLHGKMWGHHWSQGFAPDQVQIHEVAFYRTLLGPGMKDIRCVKELVT